MRGLLCPDRGYSEKARLPTCRPLAGVRSGRRLDQLGSTLLPDTTLLDSTAIPE